MIMAKSQSVRERAQSFADRAQKSFKDSQDTTREAARKGAVHMALNVIEFQRKAFNASMDGLGKLEQRTAKLLHDMAKRASWMPDEGQEVVDEWIKTTKAGRADFQKSMSTSFDLVQGYFERVDKGAAPKKKAAKKKTAAKKSAAKKPAKKKAAKKKAAKKKTASTPQQS